MKKKTETKMEKVKEEKVVGAGCDDEKCHIHGKIKARGRIFEGTVTKKHPTRIVIEFERMIYQKKYERYFRSKTKIHAHLPKCMENEIRVGDLIWIQECRPLSKIIHFVVIKKIKSGDEK
ncbi:MAG: 30S ribosomal protein S17 [Candidatus Nanoarchaeia archaeon]|nr:30S ribosomal protein S17 [Candidatus Nanoarchaeia archaeon]MDD5358196.1 30S ribosomal protein S17 [Candidatus Nanoarchaeia archaeon]MDD5589462.1 30S ribosomal protein S17 [Candidatus Nanoarchaeia archaeon]